MNDENPQPTASAEVEARTLASALAHADPDPCDPIEYDAAAYYRDFAEAMLRSDWLAAYVQAERADAWDVGYSCGLGDYGKGDGETVAMNPYRDTRGVVSEPDYPYVSCSTGAQDVCTHQHCQEKARATGPQPTTSAEVEALARLLYAQDFHAADTWDTDTSIRRGHYEGYAEAILASDWLAAYVQAARDEERAEITRRVEAELHHAADNGHILGDCQGVGPGERIPAVRVGYIRGALSVESRLTEDSFCHACSHLLSGPPHPGCIKPEWHTKARKEEEHERSHRRE